MKKNLFILTLFLIIPFTMVLVACKNKKETCSKGFSYELSLDMDSYVISGIGDCTDKDIIFPSSYNELPIIGIKDDAFKNNTGIQSITIPNSITTIGKNAFFNCSNLKTLNIKGSKSYNECFDGCINIDTVKIDNIDNWCKSTFSSSKANPLSNGAKLIENEKEITSLSTDSDIGNYAFFNYKYLTDITFSSDNLIIGVSAFENNDALKNIHFSGKVISDYNAFENCVNIKKVSTNNINLWTQSTFQTNSSNPIYYSKNLYKGNNEVKEISIETDSLSKYLFINCESIETVSFINNINKIGADAFCGCSLIKNIKINNLNNWLNVKLDNVYSNPAYYADNVYVNNTIITELIIPESITKINKYQFFGWKNLEKIQVPQTVVQIEIGAFGGCNKLKEVMLPFIGKCAVDNYTSMTDKAKCLHLGYIFGDIEYENAYHQSGYNSWYYVEYSFYIPLTLERIYIPQNVTTIDNYMSLNFNKIETDKANYQLYIKI